MMRRVVALAAVALLLFSVVALARMVTGGGDDGSQAAAGTPTTGTTTAGAAPGTATAIGAIPPNTPTDPAAQLARANVPVLCYHQIRELNSSDSAAYVTSPSDLDAQLEAIQDAGYTTVTMEQYVAHIQQGAELPAKPILITFDDGSIGHYTDALPILQRHNMVATFFIMTVVLGNDNWVTKEQVQELDAAGMSIGSHTWDHQKVTDLKTAKDFRTQFLEPRKKLEEIVGHPVTVLAYPFGIWSPETIPHLREAGYTAAFQLAEKADPAEPGMTIRRIAVGTLDPQDLLDEIRSAFPQKTPAAAPSAT